MIGGAASLKLPPLDKEEIEVALLQIEEMHPLYKRKYSEILPWVLFCFSNKKPKHA